jgi:hypothetical protein
MAFSFFAGGKRAPEELSSADLDWRARALAVATPGRCRRS